MADSRETIDARIRQNNPALRVCDNGDCTEHEAGDPTYEAWISSTVDAHVAAQTVIQEESDRKQLAQAVQAGLKQLDDDATTLETTAATIAQVRAAQARANRTTAKLIRLLGRTGTIAP